MTVEIHSLRCFPLKGGAARELPFLCVDTSVGVLHDRHLAIRKEPGDLTKRPEKFNKQHFYDCANTPAMALESLGSLTSHSDGDVVEPEELEGLRKRIGAGEMQVQDTRGQYHLCDTAGPQVSFLNLETVRAIEKASGRKIDPDRFRMNVWITGLPAFEEYGWVDAYPGTREIAVGEVRMRVDDVCERCKAIDANPRTGAYDTDLNALLWEVMKARGYKSPHRRVPTVMGFYGVVLNDGFLYAGDKIKLLHPAIA